MRDVDEGAVVLLVLVILGAGHHSDDICGIGKRRKLIKLFLREKGSAVKKRVGKQVSAGTGRLIIRIAVYQKRGILRPEFDDPCDPVDVFLICYRKLRNVIGILVQGRPSETGKHRFGGGIGRYRAETVGNRGNAVGVEVGVGSAAHCEHCVVCPCVFVDKVIRRFFKLKILYHVAVEEHDTGGIHCPHIRVGNEEITLVRNACVRHDRLAPVCLCEVDDRDLVVCIERAVHRKIYLEHRSAADYIKRNIVCIHLRLGICVYRVERLIVHVDLYVILFVELEISPVDG